MTDASEQLLERFEQLQIHAPDFHHEDHVRVAYAMLDRYEFVEACTRYAATIRTMAENVGVPDKFNATITFAFMSLIAERRATMDDRGFDRFIGDNPDLMSKSALSGWYADDRLHSDLARDVFLLSQKA